MKNSVDIIIVNYNTQEYLKDLIRSIKRHTRYPYRLIIIDNKSTDNSKDYLDQIKARGVKVIYNQSNLGTSKAWNQGIKLGSGKYIMILNPDTRVTPNWLTRLIAYAEEDEKIAIVGTKQVNQNNMIVHAGVIEKNGQAIARGIGEKDHPGKFNKPVDCLHICGACLLIKRKHIPVLGYFDERYFLYAEETDYCRHARLVGFRVICTPVTITHFTEGSPLNRNKRHQMHMKSVDLYNQKWANPDKVLLDTLTSPQVLKRGELIRSQEPTVYFLLNQIKYPIPSEEVFHKLNFRWEDIKHISQQKIDQIPTGTVLYI